jgi:tetratricopeptide (TPR) repeat protein
MLGVTFTHLGKLDEAMAAIEQSKQLNPHFSYIILWLEGRILFFMRRYDEAAAKLEEAVARNPVFDQGHIMLAAIYGQMGRIEDAEWQADEVRALRPDFAIRSDRNAHGFRVAEHAQRYAEGLRRAGLPE